VNALVVQRQLTRNLLWGVLAIVVALYAFPFAYLILTSFKTPLDAISVPPTAWPRTWSIVNYRTALAAPSGRVFIMLALVTRMIPPVAIGVPLVSIMRFLHLTDTSFGLAVAQTTISLPLSIWLMASFFEAVPPELEEAALVDGSGRLGALRRVVLPLVAGGMAVTAIFAFLASWNEFLFALLLTAVRAGTTPIAIANFQTQYGLQWGSMTALATLYSVPVVLLALVLQRRIVSGLTLGAVKG
jgi:multiple sugar transport system permease protein